MVDDSKRRVFWESGRPSTIDQISGRGSLKTPNFKLLDAIVPLRRIANNMKTVPDKRKVTMELQHYQ
jgi:hypothetical protein